MASKGKILLMDDEQIILDVTREVLAFLGYTVVFAKEGATATVLICLRPEAHGVRRVGMVVWRVLDVSAGRLLAANAAACEQQLAMVKDRVTTVHREFAQQAGKPQMAILKEVA